MGFNYSEFDPGPIISRYIEYYWSLKVKSPWNSDLTNISLPDYSSEWLFNLTNEQPSKITLNSKKSTDLIHNVPSDIFGIRFRPYGLAKIGNLDMREFIGSVCIYPQNILPMLSTKLEYIIFSSRSIDKKIRLVEKLLRPQLCSSLTIDKVTTNTVEDIIRNNGNIQINDICKKFNLSRAALAKKYQKFVGLTPKKLARISRVNTVLQEIVSLSNFSLPDLALKYGFYDQPHLNRDFKSLVGITPTQFLMKTSSFKIRTCKK